MVAGRWTSSYTRRCELGELWGVAESTIKNYSAEAHRLVVFGDDEREELRRSLCGTLQDILADARARVNERTGLPDYAAQIYAIEKIALFAGIRMQNAGALGAEAPSHIEFTFAAVPSAGTENADRPLPSADRGDEPSPAADHERAGVGPGEREK